MAEAEETDATCQPCRVSVGMGMYLSICKKLDGENACEKLYQRVVNEEITPDELFKIIKEKAKDTEDKEILEYIDKLMNGEIKDE